MSTLDFRNHLFHASAFSKLTTEPKAKVDKDAGNLSATTKTYLKEIFLEEKYGRRKQIFTKYTEKGILQEENGITVYCRATKNHYKKNEQRIDGQYITGLPDLSDNADIMKTERGVDIKCSWSIFSFPLPNDDLKKDYEWQNQCYMSNIPSAKEWVTAHCLVNAMGHQINSEKMKVYYMLNQPKDDDPRYVEACIEIEKNMIFCMDEFKEDEPNFDLDVDKWGITWNFDIPLKERVVEFVTPRSQMLIDSIPMYAEKGRSYLNECIAGNY